MVGFNIFSSLDVGSFPKGDTAPRNLVIPNTHSDEPSALASVGSSFLEAIPEVDEEAISKESKKRLIGHQFQSEMEIEETPSTISRNTDDGTSERDYDKNPTELYTFLQKRSWEEAISHIEKYPEEARIWPSMKHTLKSLRACISSSQKARIPS